MPTKEEILQYIKELGQQQIITKDELVSAYLGKDDVYAQKSSLKKLGVAEILYYIGGAIVFLGISIFLWQNWSTLSFFTKTLATLGVGIATYVTGLLLMKNGKTENVSFAFYLISALVTPVGLAVVLDNMGLNTGNPGIQSIISVVLFAIYLASYTLFKKNIFMLFSILFGTWLFFTFTGFITDSGYQTIHLKFNEYRILIIGMTYMLLGYAFSKDQRAPLSGFLYGFGVLGFLGAALFLGGWKPSQDILWELIFPGLVFGALFTSIHIKSNAFLTWGTLFLMLYILKITSEYFSSGLGWPLALVIAGLAMIGVGYMSFSIKNKYISA